MIAVSDPVEVTPEVTDARVTRAVCGAVGLAAAAGDHEPGAINAPTATAAGHATSHGRA